MVRGSKQVANVDTEAYSGAYGVSILAKFR